MSCASSICGETGRRPSLPDVLEKPWTKVACLLTAIAGGIFGRFALVTCFASLAPPLSIVVLIPVAVLSAFGGSVSAFSAAALLLGAEDSLTIACLVVAVAVIGAVGGFFLGGGPIAAIAGAFVLIGAAPFVAGAIRKICC